MKKYLIPRLGKFYKANMHCHTTCSDGKLSPEEVKEHYKKNGYSVVAFTDHEIMIPHPELNDGEFLALTATEIAEEPGRWSTLTPAYHINIYSPDPEKRAFMAYFHGEVWGDARKLMTDDMLLDGQRPRSYTKEYIQWAIDKSTEEGCLVTYNHPVWSLHNHNDYSGLRGFFGVEWYNAECANAGYIDTMQPISDLLSEGERMVYPIAADDNHGTDAMCGGWIQIKARSLDYGEIFAALKRGDFYSSNGPKIKSLYIEGTTVTVKTGSARKISLIADHRCAKSVNAKDGKLLTEASFDLAAHIRARANAPEEFLPTHNGYFRIEVEDKQGKKAVTRAYFLDELKLEKKIKRK